MLSACDAIGTDASRVTVLGHNTIAKKVNQNDNVAKQPRPSTWHRGRRCTHTAQPRCLRGGRGVPAQAQLRRVAALRHAEEAAAGRLVRGLEEQLRDHDLRGESGDALAETMACSTGTALPQLLQPKS